MQKETNKALAAYYEHFSCLEDPRDNRGKLHQLHDIIIMALLSIICGADEFTEMEEFGRSKISFLKQFLKLPNGIPSHDTFGRVFAVLCPEMFRKCFIAWVKTLCELGGDIVNIDGKALRHSYDTANDKSMIYMVSAWANANNMVLGQVKVDDKSNEITAIPKLLVLLDLEGAIVTIDAMGTQKEIAAKIREAKADYALALKGNQGNLKEEVEEAFQRFNADQSTKKAHSKNKTEHKGHGRKEERICYAAPAKDYISEQELSKWKDLTTIIKIEAYVHYYNGKKKGQRVYEERYYISSLPPDAEQLNYAIKSHWGIETKLHWVLDVAFREDDSRVRKGFADENLAIGRHIAINKLKNETSCKRGIKAKRKKAGWEEEYLLKVLAA